MIDIADQNLETSVEFPELVAARRAIARAQAAAREQRLDEALGWYAEAVKRAVDHPAGLAVRADALRGTSIVHQLRAEWSAAERALEASREAAIQLGDEARIGRAYNCFGAVAFERGEWSAAERHYAEGGRAAEATGDKELLAQIENNHGTLLAARGEHARAEEAFRRALQWFQELDQHPCVARVLNNLGLVLAKRDRHAQAAIAYDRALADSRRRGDALFAAKILINQARLYLAQQDGVQAHASAVKAWTLARRQEGGPVAAEALCLLGEVALGFRDFVGAIYYLRRALKLTAGNKAPLVEAETWVQIGNLYREQGKLERAIDTWRFARLCYHRLGAHLEAERLAERIDAVSLLVGTADPPIPTGTCAA